MSLLAPDRVDTRRTPRGIVVTRVLVAVGLAGVMTLLAALWLSGQFYSVWWQVPIVEVPAIAAAAWVGHRHGRVALIVTLALALALGSALAWWRWTPEPALFGALRAHERGATAAAEAAIAAYPPGTCSPPASIDEGPLAQLGPWAKVCVYGTVDGRIRGVDFAPADTPGALTLTYTTSSPAAPDACISHVTGHWWVSRAGNLDDPADPCPTGFTFQGGG